MLRKSSERTVQVFLNVMEDYPICACCKHYYPHYTMDGNRVVETQCGHCAYPRIKPRKAYDSCAYFERGENR